MSGRPFTTPEAYLAEHLSVLDALDATRRVWRHTFLALSGAAAATAIGLGAYAWVNHARLSSPEYSQIEIDRFAQSRDRSLLGMGVGLGVAVGAFLAGILGFAEEKDDE